MPIFDQGYQHWKGPLSGHAWRWLAVARHGVRVQLKGWMVRILLLIAWLPAIALVAALAVWGLVEQQSETVLGYVRSFLPPDMLADPSAFRRAFWTASYSVFFKVEMFFIMFLVLAAGPNLISRDLRFNALPLYLSRPLNRFDYFLGKLGVIAALVAAVAVIPAVVAYAFGVIFSLDLGVIRDTWVLLPAVAGYGLLIVVSAGTLMLALSSLSRRSLYVGIAWFGFWVVGNGVSTALQGVEVAATVQEIRRQEREAGRLVPPPPPPPGGKRDDAEWKRFREQEARVGTRIAKEMGKTAPTNWRPLFSYTSNLDRIGDEILGTDAAWVEIGKAVEKPKAAVGAMGALFGGRGRGRGAPPIDLEINERRFADQYVWQFPWVWSAGVLAGLLGLSLWTLTSRVKSLDRLK